MSKLKGVVIGFGYWNHHARLISEHPDCELVAICDLNLENLQRARELYSDVPTSINTDDFLKYYEFDFCVIATPVKTHFDIASKMIMAKKHILCEKAFTYRSEEAEALNYWNKNGEVKLQVGQTYLYNSYVQEIKKMLDEKYLGDVYYVSMTRMGNSPHRQDVGCTYDLSAHDISMLLYWFDETPKSVSAFGKSYLQDGLEDVSFVDLEFSNNVIANIRSSWINPIKRRNITIVGSKRMISFDDVAKTLEVYEGDKKILLNLEYKEPLKEQLNDFIQSINEDREPLSNGQTGLKVVDVLEACKISLTEKSRKVYLYRKEVVKAMT